MTPHAVARSPKGKAAAAGEHRLSSFVALHHIHVDELLHADEFHTRSGSPQQPARARTRTCGQKETQRRRHIESEKDREAERETEREKEKKERDTARDTETDTETDTDSQREGVQKHQVPCAHVPTS